MTDTVYSSRSTGFTLVEMALVLTIIGIVMGGIVAGRNVLESSRLRQVGIDAQRYMAATKSFQEKYAYLPGDFPTAETEWGTDTGACPADTLNHPKQRETCNGNGNGMIGSGYGASFVANSEPFRFWQHLSGASLVEGSYTGVSGSINNDYTVAPGTNSPLTQIKGGGWYVGYVGPKNATADFYNGEYGHVLYFMDSTSYVTAPYEPQLSTAQAKKLDEKLDDGLPAMGTLRTFIRASSYSGGCSDNSSASAAGTAAYDLTSSSEKACTMLFIAGF